MVRPGKGTTACALVAVFCALSAICTIPSASTITYAQSATHTFTQTGKTVSGKFLEHWQQNGMLQQQGFPISNEMQERSDTDGKVYTVQYFERAVFELHPENASPYDVLPSLLGTFAYGQKYPNGAPNQQPSADPDSVLFTQTGMRLGGRFLQYWQENGGLARHGYPISNEFDEVSALDGKTYTVQYFERAVFEYHPENSAPFDVLLTQLGTLRYKQKYPAVPASAPTPFPTRTPRPTPITSGDDWPMYGRDPGRTGYSPKEQMISTANVNQLTQIWQVALGTNGNPSSSSPVVADGLVYVGSSAPEGPNFYAFNADSGNPAWSADVGYFESCDGVGIGSTAAVSDTVLVVGGGDSAYYGLDALTGQRLWRAPMNSGTSGFAWESPLLANGRAYIGIASDCDNPSVRGEVRALDMFTGEQLASRAFVPAGKAGAGVWNSPALSPDGKSLVVVTGEDFGDYDGPYNRAMLALDPISLDVQQANKQGPTGDDRDFASSPMVFDYNGRTLVAAVHKDGNFYVYDLRNISGGPLWQRTTGAQVGMLPAYSPDNGGTILFVGRGGILYACDPETGAYRWPPVTVGSMHGGMVVANGLVFMNGGTDGLKILRGRDGRLLRTLTPPNAGPTFSGVAVSYGYVYWVAGGYLSAWGLPGR